MKNTILISINPEHVINIINGIKKFEYRKTIPKNKVSKILIYETTPTKKIVSEAEILQMIISSPDEIWNKTKNGAGITKQFFDQYFEGKKLACAYKLGQIKVYKKPMELESIGIKYAPQSFIYI